MGLCMHENTCEHVHDQICVHACVRSCICVHVCERAFGGMHVYSTNPWCVGVHVFCMHAFLC